MWWPGIDHDLEAKVKECADCQQNASAPPAKHISWPMPEHAWQRIHIDHAGPVEGRILLIVVDAKTKWLEVIPVPSTSSFATITVLRSLFAHFGVPKSLVSDNGSGFISDEFDDFLAKNGISKVLTPPYHPNSNGLAERAVRTTKAALKKITNGSFEERLARFLFNYRNTPHASTGVSPAFSMFGRSLRTRLDLLKEPLQSEEVGEKSKLSKFNVGEAVWVQNFRRGPKWIPGKILASLGNIMFRIHTSLGIWTRHADQMRKRVVNDIREHPLPVSPDLVAVPSRGYHQPVCEEETNDNARDSNSENVQTPYSNAQAPVSPPPVLSPQKDLPVIKRDHPPVLTPQVQNPRTIQNPPRRSSRIKSKLQRLQL